MTPRCFKCSQFRKGALDFNFECNKLLQNDFCKQRYMTLNATIPGQDRIDPKTHLCRTFFAEYTFLTASNLLLTHMTIMENGMGMSQLLYPIIIIIITIIIILLQH